MSSSVPNNSNAASHLVLETARHEGTQEPWASTRTHPPIPLSRTSQPRQMLISRHIAAVPAPLKPPPPRLLSDPAAFVGPNAPVWRQYYPGSGIYYLIDPKTRRPAIFVFHMRISKTWSKNWGIPKFVRKRSLSRRKFFCIGENPGGAYDFQWRKSMDQLKVLLRDFETSFPDAVEGVRDNTGSFMLQGPDDSTLLKIQHPLEERDSWMYALNQDPDYRTFFRYAEIPQNHRELKVPLLEKDEKTGQTNRTTEPFVINPPPFFDEQANLVKLTDCPSKFADKIVRVEISLSQAHPIPGGTAVPRCFVARPHAIALVEPPRSLPRRRTSEARTPASAQVKQEVKEEIVGSSIPAVDEWLRNAQQHANIVKKEEPLDDNIRVSVSRQQSVKREIKEEYDGPPNGKRRAVSQQRPQPVKEEDDAICWDSKRMKTDSSYHRSRQ